MPVSGSLPPNLWLARPFWRAIRLDQKAFQALFALFSISVPSALGGQRCIPKYEYLRVSVQWRRRR